MASSCYVCGEVAEGDCLVCGKSYCLRHGERVLCAQCSEQDEIERRAEAYEGLPSPHFFKGALAIAILAVILEIGWDAYKSVSGSPVLSYVPPTAISLMQSPTPAAQATSQPTGQASPVPPATAVPATPTPAPPAPTPTAPSVVRYTVQGGDTLGGIAAVYGVSIQALQTANNITDPTKLRVGQVLVIPPKQ